MKLNLKQTICLSLLAGCLVSCQRDSVDDVKFSVSTEQITVQAGEPVRFVFDGNPDYIIFFPGTKDCSYENRHRTKIDNLQDLKVSCTLTQNYTEVKEGGFLNEQLLRAYVSTDFTGEYMPNAIEQATWTEVLDMEMPKVTDVAKPNINMESEGNLMTYKDNDFYLAFQYEAHPNTVEKSSYGHPRIQLKMLTLHKIDTDGHDYQMMDAVNEWGFSVVPVEPLPTEGNYSIKESSINLQPKKETEKLKNINVWLISKRLNGSSIAPDLGIPIKGTNARLPYYEYRYTEPGTYKATFVATNAKMWDSSQKVCELTIKVFDNPLNIH